MADRKRSIPSKPRRTSTPRQSNKMKITSYAQEATYGQGSGRRRQKAINEVIKQAAKWEGGEGPKRSMNRKPPTIVAVKPKPSQRSGMAKTRAKKKK